MTTSLINGVGKTRYLHVEKRKLGPFHPVQKSIQNRSKPLM
jgi:hypothetical protein